MWSVRSANIRNDRGAYLVSTGILMCKKRAAVPGAASTTWENNN